MKQCCAMVCCAISSSVLSDFATAWTVACSASLSVGILQARIMEWVTWPPPGDLPNPGIEPRFVVLWADSLPYVPPGKPKNTGVCSLSLLQGNFLTQESNQGLLHCRQILDQLRYQGSPLLALSFFLPLMLLNHFCQHHFLLLLVPFFSPQQTSSFEFY